MRINFRSSQKLYNLNLTNILPALGCSIIFKNIEIFPDVFYDSLKNEWWFWGHKLSRLVIGGFQYNPLATNTNRTGDNSMKGFVKVTPSVGFKKALADYIQHRKDWEEGFEVDRKTVGWGWFKEEVITYRKDPPPSGLFVVGDFMSNTLSVYYTTSYKRALNIHGLLSVWKIICIDEDLAEVYGRLLQNFGLEVPDDT